MDLFWYFLIGVAVVIVFRVFSDSHWESRERWERKQTDVTKWKS